MRWIGLAALALIVLVTVVVMVANSDKATNEGAGSVPSTSRPGPQEIHSLGQTVHTGAFDVVANRVIDPFHPTSAVELPPLGQRVVLVELTVTNTSNEQQTMPTDLGARMLDSQSPRPASSSTFDAGLAPLEGPVGPGASRAGWVAFAVSEQATGLRLQLKSNLVATEYIIMLS